MCYYKSVKIKHSKLISLSGSERSVADYPFFDRDLISGFDYGATPVLIKKEGEDDYELEEAEWGFLPPYVKDETAMLRFRNGYKKADGQFQPALLTFNARGEELLKPGKMFREAALHRRCLFLVTGFYEWQHVPRKNKKGELLKATDKYPYYISLKNNEYFFMAGIWEPAVYDPQQPAKKTTTIITTDASEHELMSAIHNAKRRMPVILPDALAAEWIYGTLSEQRIQELANYQYPSELMQSHPVSKAFQQEPEPMQPVSYPELEKRGGDEDLRQGSLFG